jgi:Asp-tRNA(Asn)/Glu-tRNA(Gln) amidotransferase A subunit family amidase
MTPIQPDKKSLTEISVLRLAEEIRSGALSSEQLVKACLERISEKETVVQAWAFLDPEHALEQAHAADRALMQGRSAGSLHGIPVGIKDIIDTVDMPTENGTVLHQGRRPAEDAAVVKLLRSAGAVIMGKTVTTELATYHPGKTRNPHHPGHTPGGSSSGSAAAVACGMVPLAVGTQTNGSVIRPASYCGVVGFKPTYGTISRYGVLMQSRRLDQIGVFAKTIEETALIAEALMRFDHRDSGMKPFAPPFLLDRVKEEPPAACRIAFVKSPVWDQHDDSVRPVWTKLLERLAPWVEEANLSARFDEAVRIHQTIVEADIARSFAGEYERGSALLSKNLRDMIERGRDVKANDYDRAVGKIPFLNAALEDLLAGYDAILTPATKGEAPRGLESTGSPVFCTIWTLCGVPAITLPLMEGPGRLPVGVQLVGRRTGDGELLRTAGWLTEKLSG